jgi:hypothetical protein
MDARHAECAGNPLAYLLSPEISELLAELGNGQITDDQIDEIAGPQKTRLRAWVKEMGAKCATLADLDMLGEAAYHQRTETNRGTKSLQVQFEALASISCPMGADRLLGVDDVPAIENWLIELGRRRDQLQFERGKARAGRAAATIEADLTQARAVLDQKRAAAEKLQEAAGQKTAGVREAKLHQARDAAQNARKTADALRERMNLAETAKHAHEAERRDLMQQESNLRGLRLTAAETKLHRAEMALQEFANGVCPRCNTKLGKAKLAELTGPADSEAAEAREEVGALTTEQSALQEQIQDAGRAYDDATATYQRLCQEFSVADTAARDADAAVTALERDRPAIYQLPANITEDLVTAEAVVIALEREMPATDADPAAIAAEMEETEGAIKRGETALATLREIAKRDELQRQIAAHTEDAEFLSWCCETFRDGVARNRLGADGQALFVARCNETLARFGYVLSIERNGKEITLRMQKENKVAVPVSQVSDAELVIAQLALADAFGAGGIRLIDAVDCLDGRYKPVILDWLASADRFGTAVIAGAWGQTIPDDEAFGDLQAALDPVRVLWMGERVVAVAA